MTTRHLLRVALGCTLFYGLVAIALGVFVGADVQGTPPVQFWTVATSAFTSLIIGPASIVIGRMTKGDA